MLYNVSEELISIFQFNELGRTKDQWLNLKNTLRKTAQSSLAKIYVI